LVPDTHKRAKSGALIILSLRLKLSCPCYLFKIVPHIIGVSDL
jgi:hypothetical protein